MFQIYLAGFLLFMCSANMLNAENVASDNKHSEKLNSRAIIYGYKSVNRPFYVKLSFGNGYCGGSIIGENFILTAAHCIPRNIRMKVQYGDFTSPNGQTILRSVLGTKQTIAQQLSQQGREDHRLRRTQMRTENTKRIKTKALKTKTLFGAKFLGYRRYPVGRFFGASDVTLGGFFSTAFSDVTVGDRPRFQTAPQEVLFPGETNPRVNTFLQVKKEKKYKT